ncbi:hypothetical protein QBC46DRAFT_417310 [Diplogelasinospora grovesii]|uniref:Uncharacterized protein n=1 Tax=Diplogelasinospora grovesii TaxID=303347 RepID=A0AAN6N1E9_9PEZI|nr:hypothetical protein QBC46DRAFT_417310 [Diplogelasinospora grovesii]
MPTTQAAQEPDADAQTITDRETEQQPSSSASIPTATDTTELPANSDITPPTNFNVLGVVAAKRERRNLETPSKAGFRCLMYEPGELFDIISVAGFEWLARKQGQRREVVGWIHPRDFIVLKSGATSLDRKMITAESRIRSIKPRTQVDDIAERNASIGISCTRLLMTAYISGMNTGSIRHTVQGCHPTAAPVAAFTLTNIPIFVAIALVRSWVAGMVFFGIWLARFSTKNGTYGLPLGAR